MRLAVYGNVDHPAIAKAIAALALCINQKEDMRRPWIT